MIEDIPEDMYKKIKTAHNNMMARCHNPKNENFKNYGGRGITVCDAWRNNPKQFMHDMGVPTDPSYTLDRIDNEQGYFKENCQWATREQQQNNRSCNVYHTYQNMTKTIAEWARYFGKKAASFYYYLHKYNFEYAIRRAQNVG